MLQARLKTILLIITTVLTLSIMSVAYAIFGFEDELNKKLDAKKFIQSTEYYSKPISFHDGQVFQRSLVLSELQRRNYRERTEAQSLQIHDYKFLSAEKCTSYFPHAQAAFANGSELDSCLLFTNGDSSVQALLIDKKNLIVASEPAVAQFEPELFAQYVGSDPIMQENVSISQIPPNCLNAVMAIEDSDFLEHQGFSWTGLARAFVKNITRGKNAQGGSTITQQLVKNYFLTNEKTYKRKAQELVLAVLLESKYTKDQILELYLNIIYMGQSGPFQLLGFPAAAKHYFQKNISDLNLPECSLLAAILNGPGVYDPYRKAEKTKSRRDLVLKRMKDQNFISETEMNAATSTGLPTQSARLAAETAPYFIDAVRKQMKQLNLPIEGSKIYTSLDLKAQQIAQESLANHLNKLETTSKNLKANKEKGLSLEGVVLSVDSRTGLIDVAVGGRSYRMTQFNRAVDSQRQVGSIMKPIVYLTALSAEPKDGKSWTAVSPIQDELIEYKYDKQKWKPENYSKKYYGKIPLFFALKNSLNASTANLGMQIGLENIISTAQALGLQSKMQAVPALSLGAFEMKPIEVLTAYNTISRFGDKINLSFIASVVDNEGKSIFQQSTDHQSVVDPAATASLIGMMKHTLISGTAKAVTASGFTRPAAGKTGTTSDYKDVWFAGFTPQRTSLVWVGYDNNKATNLTGGSGAVPVWVALMKELSLNDPEIDFKWPENAVVQNMKLSSLADQFEILKVENTIDDQTPGAAAGSASSVGGSNSQPDANEVQLVFKKGTEP
jgi:penicillin-binding protein 1B